MLYIQQMSKLMAVNTPGKIKNEEETEGYRVELSHSWLWRPPVNFTSKPKASKPGMS